jgi:hypothetical protein
MPNKVSNTLDAAYETGTKREIKTALIRTKIDSEVVAGQKSASWRSSIDFPEARFWITCGLPATLP